MPSSRLTNLQVVSKIARQLPTKEAGHEFWQNMLTLSIESIESALIKIKAAQEAKDREGLSHTAHKLCGTVAFVGSPFISNQLITLQHLCEDDDFSRVDKEFSATRPVLEQVLSELREAISCWSYDDGRLHAP